MATRRPEHKAPPEIFYDETEAKKYTSNTRMIEIQSKLSERALELLALPEDQPSFILDVGCGSGLSGETLTENGHYWVGIDISPSMLAVAIDREIEGDVCLTDMGKGVPFKPGSFDGCISISALQWLCNADKTCHNPIKRMKAFFTSLYGCLCRGARAVFQFYPENGHQVELITEQAMKCGFSGGLVIDFPNSSKAKKIFLCLMTAGGAHPLPQALGTGESKEEKTAKFERQRQLTKGRQGKIVKGSREWIMGKKERRRRQGLDTRPDTKYTGRKRKGRF